MATTVLDNGQILVISRRSRKIGSIIPHVTIEETYEDTLEVTQHPTERGATISDHAYKRPYVVEMRIGFSDSTDKFPFASIIQYENLVALQETREPLEVFTGKRVYENMLITTIAVSSDQKTENAVMASVRLQEIRTASVQTRSNRSVDPAMPQTTVPPIRTGNVLPSLVVNPPTFPFSTLQQPQEQQPQATT